MKRLLSTIITVAVTAGLKAQLLALKTDALWDGLMTPNLGMEIVTGNKTSFGLSVFGNYKPWGMDMKMVGAIPEFRYWFGGRPMMREFIGVAALGTSYDITWGSETYRRLGRRTDFRLRFLPLTPLEHRMLRECGCRLLRPQALLPRRPLFRKPPHSARLRLHPVQTRRFLRLYHQVNPQLAYHHV